MQMGYMSNGVFLPLTFVQTHMPEIAGLEPGATSAVQLQLVLLPPHASDITPSGLLWLVSHVAWIALHSRHIMLC
jgi:ABC-type enterobactin transport system permease subunit